jgi:hypothetical protein
VNADDRELRALVDQAFELRETPYLVDAVAAIVEWHEHRHERTYWRSRAELDELRQVMTSSGGKRHG